ncbi:hypothetical protein Z043_125011, partial [Scleropages formosus]
MPAAIFFYLVLEFINFFLGAPANVMVLWLMHKNNGDSSTSDIFVWNLAIMDAIFCLIPPLELARMIQSTSTIEYILSFFYNLKNSSCLFLTCICFDYYMAVIHPVTFTALKDCWHRTVCATIIWLIALANAIIQCVGNTSDTGNAFTVMVLGAFIIMVFCNLSILRALMQSGPGRDEMHPVKKKAFRMVLIILAIIVFNYLPVVIFIPFENFFVEVVFQCYIVYTIFGFMNDPQVNETMEYGKE